jgi:hypothetical protein
MFELLFVASVDSHLAKQSSLVTEHLYEVKQENKKQEQRDFSAQHQQCHRALKTCTYEEFMNINPDRVEGTCQWVLSHPQYLHWYTKPHDDLLWISADPGCGKSVLTRSLVNNELRPTDQHTVCYFFFKDNEEQDNLATALCALLHQLFTYQPHLIRHAIPAWGKAGNLVAKEVPELWRTLVAAARDPEAQDVTCVLDALDECRPSDRRVLIEMLSGFYTQISAAASTARSGRLKFLITSRPYDDIQIEFQKTLDNLPTIRLRGEEENDQIHLEIDSVIRMRVDKLATDLKLDDQTTSQLETKLLEMEHRTYLWLHLAIQGVYETYRNSLRPEEASIRLLPSSVEDAYKKILDGVNEKQRGKVKKILQIVVGARRPLAVQEMAIALGIATSSEAKSLYKVQLDPERLQTHIRDWCGLFVFINHQRIYLIHQTAKEFLIGDYSPTASLSGWKHCLDRQGIETEMTRVCAEFICLEDIEPMAASLARRLRKPENKFKVIDFFLEDDNNVQSFLVYSAEYWPFHLRDAQMPIEETAMAKLAQLCDTDSPLYERWFPIFWRCITSFESQPQINAIHLAAILGHGQLLKRIMQLNQQSNINELDNDGRTALIRAAEFNCVMAVQTLLEHGADINAQGGEFGNSLQAASLYGHVRVVETLLEHGADINAQGGYYDNALKAAEEKNYTEVVKMLLERGARRKEENGPQELESEWRYSQIGRPTEL